MQNYCSGAVIVTLKCNRLELWHWNHSCNRLVLRIFTECCHDLLLPAYEVRWEVMYHLVSVPLSFPFQSGL